MAHDDYIRSTDRDGNDIYIYLHVGGYIVDTFNGEKLTTKTYYFPL